MDGAASIVSLIQFTIKGLEILHRAFSSVKEGHDTVSVLVKDADDLLHVLERLRGSPVVGQSCDDNLFRLMIACHDDVTRMAKSLEDLDINKSDSRRLKLWKSVRSAAKEKELREFQTRLHDYSTRLMTFIMIEDSDKICDISSKVASVHEELRTLVAKCENIETKCVGVENVDGEFQLQSLVDSIRQVIQDELSSQSFNTSNEALLEHTSNIMPTKLSPDKINDTTGAVDKLTNLVKARQADLGSATDTTQDIVKDISKVFEEVKRLTAEAANLRKRAVSPQSVEGRQSQGFFYYRELRFTPDTLDNLSLQPWQMADADRNIPSRPSKQQYGPDTTSSSRNPSSPEQSFWSVKEVSENSRSLKSFITHNRMLPERAGIKPVVVNKKTLVCLLQWSKAEVGRRTLWLRGRYTPQRALENSLTCICHKLVILAEGSGVPIISYFCQMETKCQLIHSQSLEVVAMTSFLHALIWQLLQHLPSEVSRHIDLSKKRFAELDGTKASWNSALTMLSEIIRLTASPVFCILDGVQWLEHDSTQKHLEILWQTLQQGNLNTLITTTGTSLSLRDAISREQTLTEEDLKVGGATEYLERHSERFWVKS